ncbi:MAG: DUF5916 domain-containing protein [Cyclobacteriaceae bacterium]
MTLRFLFSLVLVLAFASIGCAQGITIRKISNPIILDGRLDEAVWLQADVAGAFRQYFPLDTGLAQARTEVRLLYDDQFIYVGAKMYNTRDRKYVTPSLRRDYRGEANDGISIVLDTYMDKTNAFIFGVNPFGVQREGLISNGGNDDGLSLNWDNKWYAEVQTYDGYWIAEMAIPFKSIRFKANLSSWLINFYRIDSDLAERSTWAPIPRVFSITNLAFNRELKWEQPLASPGANVSVIPYGALRTNRNFEDNLDRADEMAFGGDAKIALSPALNLDLTVNPDFSQVEVDDQVTNLDRFEIFFPERRQFFLENADLFSDFGLDGLRPFFSRRIGVTRDTSTGSNVQNAIYAGARLSGKINNNLRVGMLNMQAGKDEKLSLPSINYTVGTLQYKLFSRSNIGLIVINKQAFQDSLGTEFTLSPANYNRMIGVDYNLASADNRWTGKFFYHRSFQPDNPDSTYSMAVRLAYNTLRWDISGSAFNVGANYNPEVGFVRRRNYLRLAPTIWYNIYPDSRTIQSHGPGFDFDVIGNDLYGLTDYDVNFMYRIRWKNTANFNMRLRTEYVYLFNSFDPTNTGGLELPAGSDYRNYVIIANFDSDARRRFAYSLSTRSGGYFNGTRANLDASLGYRYQPYGVVSLGLTYNGIRMPDPYNSADLLLIGPKFDFTFSRKVFWTTYLQYNSQINNLNINSRLQWRFKPVSDLFIVYTDNYFAESFDGRQFFDVGQPKLRALVIKLTYWLNL